MLEKQPRLDQELPTDQAAQMRRAISRLCKAALALGAIVVGGTAGYVILEGWAFVAAYGP